MQRNFLASLLLLVTAHPSAARTQERKGHRASLSLRRLRLASIVLKPCFTSVLCGTSLLGETGKEKRVEVLFAVAEA